MRSRSLQSHPVRLLIVCLSVLGLLATMFSATASAAASATYSRTVTTPAPPDGSFSGSSGVDTYSLGFTATQVFGISHAGAISSTEIACNVIATGATCANYPIRTSDYVTYTNQEFSIDQSNGRLYTFARNNSGSVGVLCVDTTKPLDPICGFAVLGLGSPGPAPFGHVVGSKIWALSRSAMNNGVAAGAPALLCFDLSSHTACPSQPFAIHPTEAISRIGSSQMTAIGTNLFINSLGTPASTGREFCFDTTTSAPCAGAWPVAVSEALVMDNTLHPEYAQYSVTEHPRLDASGAYIGVCFFGYQLDPQCFTTAGAPTSAPANLATVFRGGRVERPSRTSESDTGGLVYNSMIVGSRSYALDYDQSMDISTYPGRGTSNNSVVCYDFATESACSGFPVALPNTYYPYTLSTAPGAPACIWVDSDHGTEQMKSFDAFTGGDCGVGGTRVLLSSYVVPTATCAPTKFETLTVSSPLPADYSASTVHFVDANGDAIPGIADQSLTSGSLDLSGLAFDYTKPLPQMLITLTGATDQPIVAELTWTGVDDASCAASGQSRTSGPVVPDAPTSVSATAAAGGASLSWTAPANDGGSAITGYVVQYSSDGGANWSTYSGCPGTGTTCDLTGLTNGTSYTFQVAATNIVGDGPYSSPSGSVTPAPSDTFTCGANDYFLVLHGQLHRGNPRTGWTLVGARTSPYNAMGFNPNDGYLYAVGAAPLSVRYHHLLRIASDGSVTDLGAIAGLPSTAVPAGDIDPATGNLWVLSKGQILVIDITTRVATSVRTGLSKIGIDLVIRSGHLIASTGSAIIDFAVTGASLGTPRVISVTNIERRSGAMWVDGSTGGGILLRANGTGRVLGLSAVGLASSSATMSHESTISSLLGAPLDGATCTTIS